jgi:hypothetical protein
MESEAQHCLLEKTSSDYDELQDFEVLESSNERTNSTIQYLQSRPLFLVYLILLHVVLTSFAIFNICLSFRGIRHLGGHSYSKKTTASQQVHNKADF